MSISEVQPFTLKIPELSLVLLIGPSGSGKSTFAKKHFKTTEVISSDYCRGLVSDDENNQAATKDAFEVLHFIAAKRLAVGKLTVIDATNVQEEARKPLVQLARQYHCLPVAIVFDLHDKVCHSRNKDRSDRNFGSHIIRQQSQQLRRSLRMLEREGFRYVYRFESPEEVDAATIIRQTLWNNKKEEHGPFDIIGDIHGCFDELKHLLETLGYQITRAAETVRYTVTHPAGRKAVFLGDLVDRGPNTPEVLRLVMDMTESEAALCVPGNHEMKLLRKLKGRDVQITHGLAESLAQLEKEPLEFHERVVSFIQGLVSHYVLDSGELVVAHAGLKQDMQGRGSGKVKDFALYGETTGETDEFGLPIRYNWAAEYRGKAMVVYGHTPVPEPEWLNRTVNIDTGCVYGGKLTALRYPEREFVSVPAAQTYYESVKPFLPQGDSAPVLTAQQQHDDVLDIQDVLGKRLIKTRYHHTVTIREENAIAALEVMSRFAINQKWLIYLPPTMSPSETSTQEGYLEHPSEAVAYYRHNGVSRVVCEEKHMGSRAVVIVCRDEDAARSRFGVIGEGIGTCFTRTGRRFFSDEALERAFLEAVRRTVEQAGWWSQFSTDWVCLDCELMPWSAKAQELLRHQYAAVGAASRSALPEAVALLQQATAANPNLRGLRDRYVTRATMADQYVAAYRKYCWPVQSLTDYKLAPFHLLATEGKVHTAQDHVWHMETLAQLHKINPDLFIATPYRIVDVTDSMNEADAIKWWVTLTAAGGEGTVVKPLQFIATSRRGLVQPAVKCRGREYLRIIYGPEYSAPEHLERLRNRGLSSKRSLALREFALGIEALERFVRLEPLRRVHECVFGVLALESEPIDPRL